MSRIRLLSEQVASQVAAGEVVERPASVVKELVENSLDAGATHIEVAIRRGGISSIRVTDDGCGMDRDDALLCLERHATSKIRTGADLAAIRTLGFRGEALPSIASVSRFRLATRERGAEAGTEILVNGGKIESVRECGDAPGTSIEARHLFYNLPARRKFLRTENTESSHVQHQLMLQAVGHPGVGFVLVEDGRTVWQLPPAAGLLDRVRDLAGADLAAQMIELARCDRAGITVSGLICKPGVSRATRAGQIVFVNGRPVENPILNQALREGYHTALMKGQFPVTYLFVEMDPAAVDVNVHPAKREVRFRDGIAVREAVVEAVRAGIESGRDRWRESFRPVAGLPAAPTFRADWAGAAGVSVGVPVPDRDNAPEPELPIPVPQVSPSPPLARPGAPEMPAASQFRILGVLGKLYVLMENAEGLVLVDQHAAHERILFEELRKRMETGAAPSQRLLIPATVQVPPRDADWIERNLETLAAMGVAIEPFGPNTFKVDGLPPFLRCADPAALLRYLVDELRRTSGASSKMRLGEDVIAKTVCRWAVKANDALREPELVKLVEDLLACDLPYCCPHGRPTMIQISFDELERKFGRRV